MGEAREIVGLVEDFDPDQAASLGQLELFQASPVVDRQMDRGIRGVGANLEGLVVGADGEDEARAEGVRRAQQIAEIDGLGDALHADGEIAARYGERGFHQSCLPQPAGRKGRGRAERALPYEQGFACYIVLAAKRLEAARCALRKFREFGGIAALRLEEAAEPAPGPAKSSVRVTAVGLNFSDTLMLRNKYQVTPQLPFSPGAEIAGSIAGFGAGVTDLKLGQRIVACIGGNGCRELIVTKASERRSHS